jgi:hypothetical protein
MEAPVGDFPPRRQGFGSTLSLQVLGDNPKIKRGVVARPSKVLVIQDELGQVIGVDQRVPSATAGRSQGYLWDFVVLD